MADSLNMAFRGWLVQLAEELDWTVEGVAQNVGLTEADNRLSQYPRLAAALADRPLDRQQLRDIGAKCWAIGGQQDQISFTQFTKAEPSVGLIENLIDGFPSDDSQAADRIDGFVNSALEFGYRHPEKDTRHLASAALMASVILTSVFPKRFVDFRHQRWEDMAEHLTSSHPAGGSADYGARLVWAGRFAQEITQTETFRSYWPTGESTWVIAGVCWDAMTKKGMGILRSRRLAIIDEREYDEGKERLRWHKTRERRPELVRLAKEKRLETDPLLHCDVCGFSFVERYGELGRGFIEAHHTTPLSELALGSRTKMEDLAMVCSNCHSMLHRDEKTLSIDDLKLILAESGAG